MQPAILLGAAGARLSGCEESYPWLRGWVPYFLFPSHADPQVAQVILARIAASIMTVVSIVFATLLMTLTPASMQFSPRILVSFVRDRTTQWTLGLFLGSFAYCMGALPAARALPRPFALVSGAMLLAMLCAGWLIFFIQHISQAISVNHIVDRIARDAEAIIDETMPHPRARAHVPGVLGFEWNGSETAVPNLIWGYIRYVDGGRLVQTAKAARLQVRVLRGVGHFIPARVPWLVVNRGSRLRDGVAAAWLAAFDIGPTCTLQQDVEFGVRQDRGHRAEGHLAGSE